MAKCRLQRISCALRCLRKVGRLGLVVLFWCLFWFLRQALLHISGWGISIKKYIVHSTEAKTPCRAAFCARQMMHECGNPSGGIFRLAPSLRAVCALRGKSARQGFSVGGPRQSCQAGGRCGSYAGAARSIYLWTGDSSLCSVQHTRIRPSVQPLSHFPVPQASFTCEQSEGCEEREQQNRGGIVSSRSQTGALPWLSFFGLAGSVHFAFSLFLSLSLSLFLLFFLLSRLPLLLLPLLFLVHLQFKFITQVHAPSASGSGPPSRCPQLARTLSGRRCSAVLRIIQTRQWQSAREQGRILHPKYTRTYVQLKVEKTKVVPV